MKNIINIKRLILIIVLGLFYIDLMGCCKSCATEVVNADANNSSMFVVIQDSDYEKLYYIAYHRDTKVMYAISDGQNNRGEFTVLVNADGTPMLYEDK